MSNFSQFFGGGGGSDVSIHSVYGLLKPSIVLFDINAGTKSFTVPDGVTKIRAFVVGGGGEVDSPGAFRNAGGGGGYSEKEFIVSGGDVFSYTVGSEGGTSSFGGVISATGGQAVTDGDGGSGSGGDINTNGGFGNQIDQNEGLGGGGAGHRFGDGYSSNDVNGGGFIDPFSRAPVDGFGIGLLPSNLNTARNEVRSNLMYGVPGGIGGGGSALQGQFDGFAGGGGAIADGFSATGGRGAYGVVGVEVLEVE